MHISRLLAVPVLLTLATGASALAPVNPVPRVLELVPGQAQTLMYYPDFRQLEAKWSRLLAIFGSKDGLLELKGQTGIDPSHLGSGPLARVSFHVPGQAETWAWLLPTKDSKAVLQGLHITQKAGVWSWDAPAPVAKKHLKAAAPTPLFAMAKAGFLVVANSEADLAAFRKPTSTLAAELAPYSAWLESHDLSVVATQAAVAEAAQAASQAFQPKAVEPKAGAATPPPSKAGARLQSKFSHWADLARTSVHHALFGLDLSKEGGLTFQAQALLTKDSDLSRELTALPPVVGHPLNGLSTPDFALAFGGEWSMLYDFQTALLEDLDKAGKVQPATAARLQKALATQTAMVRSMAGTFSAPAPRTALLSGLTSIVRVSDSQAYLAAMDETSRAQGAFFQDLGMPDAVTFTRGILPEVPSCGVTTRLAMKDDPAMAAAKMAVTMLLGGESIEMSMGALDDHRILAVMGGRELLKARLDDLRKAPQGLAPSIAAVEPDLGKDHRFVLFVDPRGLRDMASVLAGAFGGPDAKPLPAIPEVPAAGLTLSLDPAMVELRGAVRAETLKATATLFKAIGAMMPTRKGTNPGPDQEPGPGK